MTTSPTSLDRRSFIQLLTAISVGGLSVPANAQSGVRFASSPFKLGIASGAPSADGFVLWTRLQGPELARAGDVPVNWEVFDIDSPATLVAQGVTPALAELGHSVHVEVAGMAPNKWYGYRFKVGTAVSVTGKTRTLPTRSAAARRLRLASANCQRWEDGFYAAYRQMVVDAPDLVLFTGDYIYDQAPRKGNRGVRTHNLPQAKTLADYRARYALYRSDPDLQAMHAACPWLFTWDDHEVENNYAGELSVLEGRNIAGQRKQAYQAFYENQPLRAAGMLDGLKGGEFRLYADYDFGNLARIYMLDNRQYRDKPLCSGGAPRSVCDPSDAPGRSMLGQAQERWLARRLTDAATDGKLWNIIGQETRFSPGNFRLGKGTDESSDNWDGYPGARQRLIDALVTSRAQNPVILGGDIHSNWVANVHAAPYNNTSPVVAAEFCSTSISSEVDKTPEKDDHKMRINPHAMMAESQYRGYHLIDCTPQTLRVTVKAVKDVTRRDSTMFTLAEYVVEHGNPALRKV